MIKSFFLKFIKFLSFFWRIIPRFLRRKIIFFFFVLESRVGTPENALRNLFFIYDDLDDAINERACAYGQGVHPKKRIMQYDDFFLSHINNGENVIDIGCYHGVTANYIAQNKPLSKVIGIEIDEKKCEKAKKIHSRDNLHFICADATRTVPPGKWDVIILSNVLEHIENRVDFLKKIITQINPKKVLIRLPNFERSWHLPLRKELGIYYFSDPTHYIEPSISDFKNEIYAAGLLPIETIVLWGEIWALCQQNQGTI